MAYLPTHPTSKSSLVISIRKRLLILIPALLLVTACGSKSKSSSTTTTSTRPAHHASASLAVTGALNGTLTVTNIDCNATIADKSAIVIKATLDRDSFTLTITATSIDLQQMNGTSDWKTANKVPGSTGFGLKIGATDDVDLQQITPAKGD